MKLTVEVAAGDDPVRLKILATRKANSVSRSRFRHCPTCDENVLDNLLKTDVCDPCLIDMWNARSIKAGAYKAGQRSGLMPFRMVNVWHWLDYPRLMTSNEDTPPKTAIFARNPHGDRVEGAASTLQILTVELVEALATVLPCDPDGRDKADHIISGSYPLDDTQHVFVRLPKKAADAIRGLWALLEWHSHDAYRQGFDAGRSLLTQLNTGESGYESFTEEVAKQIGRTQEQRNKIVAGAPRRR